MKQEGNFCLGTVEKVGLKSTVMAFIVDGGQKGRTLEEICRKFNLEGKGARDILFELWFLRLVWFSISNATERWFSLVEVA